CRAVNSQLRGVKRCNHGHPWQALTLGGRAHGFALGTRCRCPCSAVGLALEDGQDNAKKKGKGLGRFGVATLRRRRTETIGVLFWSEQKANNPKDDAQ